VDHMSWSVHGLHVPGWVWECALLTPGLERVGTPLRHLPESVILEVCAQKGASLGLYPRVLKVLTVLS